MEFTYLKIIFTVMITMIGWYITHWFNSKRDHKNKIRETKMTYWIEAYLALENVCSRYEEDLISRFTKLEDALAKIQLLGSDEQILMAKKVIDAMDKDKKADVEELLQDIRAKLRKEIGLSKTTEQIAYLRFGKLPKNV